MFPPIPPPPVHAPPTPAVKVRSTSASANKISPPAAAPAAAAKGLKLFPDSRLVVGDRIGVEVVGQGRDVVLIPGLAASRQTWRRTAVRLRGRFRLHLVQVMGFAGAPPRANASGPVLAPTVEALDAYIRKAGLKRAAVVGHGLGGLMALELALDHPEDVGALLVVDAAAFHTELVAGAQATVAASRPFAEGLAERLRSEPDADYAAAALKTSANAAAAPADRAEIAGWITASSRATVAAAMVEDLTTDLRRRIPALRPPLTVFYEATLAPVMQADYAQAPVRTLVAAKPGAGHFLMDDDPANFDAVLDALLAAGAKPPAQPR